MGHLLGAVTQDKLDKQRGVVQNEKRQGDNQPYGLVDYKIGDALFPVGHPYRHSTIGSMADLDAASLADVRKWFTDNYGAQQRRAGARRRHRRRHRAAAWSSAGSATSRAGPRSSSRGAEPVTLAAPVREEMTDQVPVTRIYRAWTGPALTDPDAVPLALGMHVLGGLASSRLDNALVRGEQLAVAVTAERPAARADQLPAGDDGREARASTRAAAEAALRRSDRRADRQGPDRGRARARGDADRLGRDRRARAGRRLLRQGRDARRRAALCGRSGAVQGASSSRWRR